MAAIEFNAAWWKKHSAKTLVGSGMEEALKRWESSRKAEGDKLVSALTELHKAAVAAERKANKTLHKETIGYLQSYQKQCADFISRLKKADGKSLATPDKILSKLVLPLVEKHEKGKLFAAELNYLAATKGKADAATKAIYDTFIKPGSKQEVNLDDGELQKKCGELAKAGTWKDKTWADARDVIEKNSLKGANLDKLRTMVLAPLEAEPIENEIRAA